MKYVASAAREADDFPLSFTNVIESEFTFEFAVQAGLIVHYRLFENSFAVAQAAQGQTKISRFILNLSQQMMLSRLIL